MKKKLKPKIMIVSTGRADYGLLSPIIDELFNSLEFETLFVVTGGHLSEQQGKTIKLLNQDSRKVYAEIIITPFNTSDLEISKAVGDGLTLFSKLYATTKPDLLIVLGDRYELLSICTAALLHKIPIAHIHGGEETLGAIDNSIRHAVTKMSSLHFASTEQYAKRIVQMGENPNRVFNVGALGLDNIKNISLLSRHELSKSTGIDFSGKIALMTYHPVTLQTKMSPEKQVQAVLKTLLNTELFTLITMPNSDSGGEKILEEIESYSNKYQNKFAFLKNLGQKRYLSAMNYATLMIGNSSSGIIESVAFHLPVVNIGERQTGRLKTANIIDCNCQEADIKKTINKALSKEFQNLISNLENPYGKGIASKQIFKILKSINLCDKDFLLKKVFYTH